MADKWLTPADVAEMLVVSQGTLRNWRYLGKGPAFTKPSGGKKNGAVRYRLRDIEAHLKAQTQEAAA